MRTTLSIDDDVLLAAKALAERDRRSLGAVVSELVRRGLNKPFTFDTRNGLPLLPRRGSTAVVTLEIVNALRDEEP